MMRAMTMAGAVLGVIVLGLCVPIVQGDTAAEPESDPQVLRFTMNDIDGEPQDLAQYRGDVVLIVNVASKCGLTPQYEGLEALYRELQDEGFVILGFPANDFMGQEPGSELQIKTFCSETYGVTFPLFSKISVTGEDRHPLYAALTGQPEPVGGPVKWNFQKYLVDRSGNVVERFSPRVTPDDEGFRGRLDELLAAPVPAG